jgi:hypothetical protein
VTGGADPRQPAGGSGGAGLAERSLVLTIATFVLLTPPILGIFDVPVTLFGIPLLHIYCFAAWLAAIALGQRLALRMQADAGPAETPDGGEPGERG